MQQLPKTTLPGSQQGATLVVALIMLILISLIGVSSLKSASVVEKMSANDYQKNITFQASESAAEVTLQDTVLISQALVAQQPVAASNVITGIPNASADVVFTPAGVGEVFENSLGENGFSGQRIMVTSTGTLTTDSNIRSRTVHGIVRLVPGS